MGFVQGFLSGGLCPGGFCPDTIVYIISNNSKKNLTNLYLNYLFS